MQRVPAELPVKKNMDFGKFFFGSSSSKRHRSNSDSESRAGHQSPSSSGTGAASPSDTPSQAPHRKGRLRRSLSMKRLRRSFRGKAETPTYVPPASKPHQWQQDEKLVRGGTCNFSVKYLGSIEVTESRGMQICEDAANQLRRSTKKKVRAVLWVSSDGLRVVEEESKGLIVDQTIEKVSFCAPDRNNDKGFSYICRDGTTRRWLCHCFHSLKEPGERLSHAVGCAFAACLERKQQRDKLCGVQVEFDVNKTSFTRQGSFRVQTMTEAMEASDVGVMDEKENKGDNTAKGVPGVSPVLPPNAIPRRHASSDMLLRQGSVRLGKIGEVTPFKRQLSLRLSDLPSTLQRQQQVLQTHEEVSPPTSPHDVPPATTNGHPMTNGTNGAVDQSGGISTACAQLSEGLFELSRQGEATPPPIPQRPRPAVHQQHPQPVSNRGQAVKPTGILKPEPGPIKQKNPWEGSPVAAPPQASAQQPTPPPRPKPAPGLTGVVPPPGSSTNPWAGLQPPALQPDTYIMPQPDTYTMPQQSQYASPGMVNGQQLATAQVHGGGMPPLQNGIGMHPQASANFNNANANMAAMPYGSPAGAGGIGGTWTADLSRTLPQNVNVSPNVAGQPQGYDPSWAGAGHQATPPQQVNPFNNTVKTFEINL